MSNVEQADLLTIALVQQLAELDELDDAAVRKRARFARESLDLIGQLELIGGGSLGSEKLNHLRSALEAAIQ